MTDDTTAYETDPNDTAPYDTSAYDTTGYDITGHDDASSGGPPPEPTVEALVAAGFDVSALSEEQHEVLRALTVEELALLVDIRGRLDAAAPEVQAHADVAGGALF
ncbi:aroma-sacti cluster domain-containing protein [Streptomyces sp. 24-1644]|uniref:aroma-sacti cluster domain-containing protein n=1 Tax=Streptomyces sp. 24-1644 TaxID=3457315 RepID=UPI003FA7719E